MRTFERADERTKFEERLPVGQSAAVITGLSVLSWGIVILAIVGLQAVL